MTQQLGFQAQRNLAPDLLIQMDVLALGAKQALTEKP
jgi:hypothetical protein